MHYYFQYPLVPLLTIFLNRHFREHILTTELSGEMATVGGEVSPPSHCNPVVTPSQLTIPQALAFGYFEALLRQGDSSKILAEAARLKSFNTLLDSMGWNEEFYEDFVHETLELLKKTATSIDDGTLILDRFNDQAKCSAITYHFKVISASA